MTTKRRSPLWTLASVAVALAALIAVLHWYDTKRLNEQVVVLEGEVCAALATGQIADALDRVVSFQFPENGAVETGGGAAVDLRELLRLYGHQGWRLRGAAYFGREGRWWRLGPYGAESLTEIDHAPLEMANTSTAQCTVKPGATRNDVKVVMPFQRGEVEAAIVVSARRDH